MDNPDRPRFLGLAAQFGERFGTGIHAFVLMANHDSQLVRCRGIGLSETLGLFQTEKAMGIGGGVRCWRWRRALWAGD